MIFSDLSILNSLLDPSLVEIDEFVYDLKFATPFELTLIASIISNRGINIVNYSYYKSSEQSLNYANYVNFFNHIGYNTHVTTKHNERYYPIKHESLEGYIRVKDNVVERLSKTIVRIISDDENLSGLLNYAISEILRNIPEHSGQNNAWVSAQNWYHKDYKEIEIAIVDYGIGLANKLSEKYGALDDRVLIHKAISPGITTSSYKVKSYEDTSYENSGYGTYVVSQLCNRLSGEFIILTNNVLFRFSENNYRYSYLENKFEGTAIKIKLQLKPHELYRDLIREIVKAGEIESENIDDAVKKASQRSRMLD